MQSTCIMRTNIYREKIIDILMKNHLLTISDIHVLIPKSDYSTIFRNIENLCKDKVVKKVVIDKGVVLYEFATDDMHDHFICDDCGKCETIHLDKDFGLGRKIVKDILLKGTCADCNH